MSIKGIKQVAKIFFNMQQVRIQLLKNSKDHQNILLGQLLETMKEENAEKFAKITLMKGK